MGERSIRSWWRDRLPDLSATVARFPLAVVIAALLAIYRIAFDGRSDVRVIGALIAAFLWVVAVDFYAEARKRALPLRVLLWLVGLLAIALLFFFAWDVWLFAPLLLGALLILVGLAGFPDRGATNPTFWLFNHRLWLGALLAVVAAVLFTVGLSIILQTLNALFGLGLSGKWHDYFWLVSTSFIAPVGFLAFAPRNFTDCITAREEGEFVFRAIAALVRFVLVPLLLVYTAILYLYAVKIALAWELPKGTLGAMVVGYLLAGTATLLIGYPSRETGGPHVRFFWRYWVALTALPVVLLFIAVWRRIGEYGLTEHRYLMVLVGVWALILAGFRIARGRDFDLRLVPGVLALLLAAASFGPGGAIGFSVMSQKAELAAILAAKGVLVDSKVVPQPQTGDSASPLAQDAARMRDITWYLDKHHALDALAPWFAGLAGDPFAPDKKPSDAGREVLVAFGLRPDRGRSAGLEYFTHYSDVPAAVATATAGQLIGPVLFQIDEPGREVPPQTIAVSGLGDVTFEIEDALLKIGVGDVGGLTFNLADGVGEIGRRGGPLSRDHTPIVLEASAGGLHGTLLIENPSGNFEDPDVNLLMMRFWLIVAPGA